MLGEGGVSFSLCCPLTEGFNSSNKTLVVRLVKNSKKRRLVIVGLLWLCSCIPIMLMCVRSLISSLKPIHAYVTLQEDMSKK